MDDAKTKKCILPCTSLAVVKIMEHVGIYDEELPVGDRLQGKHPTYSGSPARQASTRTKLVVSPCVERMQACCRPDLTRAPCRNSCLAVRESSYTYLCVSGPCAEGWATCPLHCSVFGGGTRFASLSPLSQRAHPRELRQPP